MKCSKDEYEDGGKCVKVREPLEGVRKHKLMPKELSARISRNVREEADPMIQAHYFSPYSNWDWWAVEFDGEDILFGLVKGFETELGSFSLNELAETQIELMGTKVPAVERDTGWTPIKLSELREKLNE